MLEPVKVALGEYLHEFYVSIVPTTKALESFVTRGFDKGFAWAPARMIDSAEEMLASWQRNDTDSATTAPAKVPVVLVAMSKDYTPTMRDFTTQIPDPVMVMLPDDAKERVFELKTIAGDIRAQIVIFAHDEQTAKSIASQFLLFIDSPSKRRFFAKYSFAGTLQDWPVQLESTDSPAQSIQTDAKNLTILAVDIMLKASIPMFKAPSGNEPNDGKGDGSAADPNGYMVVSEVSILAKESA